MNCLLKEREDVAGGKRTAKVVSVITLVAPDGKEIVAGGECRGHILFERHGSGGFGYDPLFLYEPLNKTFAEVTEEEKNQISHRARACEKMLEIMKGLHE